MAEVRTREVRVARLLPAVVVSLGTIILLIASGVQFLDGTRYTLATALTVLAPGMLVHRAARGRPGTLIEDLALGYCTGLALQLLAWAGFTALGWQQWLGLWPVLVIVPLAAFPRFRSAWTLARYPRVLHPATSWLLATATLIGFALFFRTAPTSDLPPTKWYPDTYWHLGAVAELMRTPVPHVPQVAGLDFHYHWFVNAHMAAMTLTSGVDPVVVVSRLWVLPLLAVIAGMLVAVSVAVVGKAWPGAVAAVLVVAEAEIRPGSWYRLPGGEVMSFLSPSQVFALPLTLFAILVVVPLLRGRRLGAGGWVIALLAVGVLGGAKSSALPVLLCGGLLTLFMGIVRRQGWRGPALATGLFAAGLAGITLPLSSGGSEGATVQPFAILGWSGPWQVEMGGPPALETFHDPVLAGLTEPTGGVVLAMLVLGYVVAYAFAALGTRPLSQGWSIVWFLAGTGLAGWCAMLLVNHDGLSQAYFMRGAVIAWHLLAALALVPLTESAIARRGRLVTAGTLLLGSVAGTVVVLSAQAAGGIPQQGQVVGSMAISFGVIATGAGLIGAATLLLPRALRGAVLAGAALGAAVIPQALLGHAPASSQPLLWDLAALLIAVVAGAALILGARRLLARAFAAGLCVALAVPGVTMAGVAAADFSAQTQRWIAEAKAVLTPAELAATEWLARTTPPTALVATNVHCVNKLTWKGCDARAFWVSGLGQRRVLIEGWAYTEQAHAAHGIDGQSSRTAPFYDPELFALNERAFAAPTRSVLNALWARGVRYLFADEGAGPVAVTQLTRLANCRFAADGVYIFEL